MTDNTETPEETKPRSTARKPAAAPTPHVNTAMQTVLATLGVEKSGQLPSNMGGKPYITAVDVAKEVKKLFVENDLIFLPVENLEHYEIITDANGRKAIFIAITLKATIRSVRDGSEVVIGGTGDGLANGTAVASNIASTNAFKNALLRTFLITEQSVEDAAKNGDVTAETKTIAAAAGAKTIARPAAQKGLKDQVREDYIEKGKTTKEAVNALLGEAKDAGHSGDSAWVYVLDKLKPVTV